AGAGDAFRWNLDAQSTEQIPAKLLALSRGMAAAIDSRGYFLTACHCVNTHQKLTIAYKGNSKSKVGTPRVVARMPELDVALVCVDAPLSETFAWAPSESIKPGEMLLVGGALGFRFIGETLN